MVVPIPNKVKRMWREWNLRVAVLISLFFQVLLIFIAPSRKNTKNRIVTLLVWGAYLLADWIAVLSVGLICSGQGNDCDEYCVKDDLAAFWAPFLLLHLGGPDTITAFSLEDNELWLRHLLGLFIQLAAVVYAFWQSVPNQFQIPTIFMFFAGTIKYAERTRALYLACFGNLKRSMLPNYALLIKEVKLMLDNIPFGIVNGKELETWDEESLTPNPLTDIDVVKNGYMFFQIIKRLIVFLTFTFPERHKSRKIFLEMTCKDAFRVMEMELNFMYDALYTKMVVVQRKIGYAFRFICSVLIVVSFALFASHHKHQLQPLDIVVTYTLLIGAVGLDFVSLVKLIFSNYTIVSLNNSNAEEIVFAIKERLSFGERCQRSNFVSQHSLISDCIINEQFKWFERVVDFFGLKDFFDEIQYKRNSPLTDDLKEFILMDVRIFPVHSGIHQNARNFLTIPTAPSPFSEHPPRAHTRRLYLRRVTSSATTLTRARTRHLLPLTSATRLHAPTQPRLTSALPLPYAAPAIVRLSCAASLHCTRVRQNGYCAPRLRLFRYRAPPPFC
ncbi:hypothetical protein HYC85_011684 [Camellia sinensis]|uniref:DUF4220 domain-containing protein n=1 Tax=Camellia sinensis TaxID=4442 RepID=A0A7J7HBN2_CAMSI|nr:hypothetical protein HYC85_011684 [Camellia sinensis]